MRSPRKLRGKLRPHCAGECESYRKENSSTTLEAGIFHAGEKKSSLVAMRHAFRTFDFRIPMRTKYSKCAFDQLESIAVYSAHDAARAMSRRNDRPTSRR